MRRVVQIAASASLYALTDDGIVWVLRRTEWKPLLALPSTATAELVARVRDEEHSNDR